MTPSASPDQVLYYVVDWLPPDFGAVGQYAMLFATELATDGQDVRLIGLTHRIPSVERLRLATGTLEVRRLFARSYDKSRRVARLWWTLRVNARLLAEVVRHRDSKGAELLFTGSPPVFLPFAMAAKYLRGMRLTYRITDFHPEAMIADRGAGLLLRLVQRLTWILRRRVDRFEVLGEDQRRLLVAGRIAADRIGLKRDKSPIVVTGRERPLPRPGALGGYKVLLYSGNYGVAHDADTVAQGMVLHHRNGTGRFALWLNATGARVDQLSSALEGTGVPFARTTPVPLEALPSLLAAADVHLVTLRPAFAGIVLPSKIHACIASRRPILFVGPEGSDVHLLSIRSNLPYRRIEPGDAEAFARTLDEWAMPTRAISEARQSRTADARSSTRAVSPARRTDQGVLD